MRCFHLPCYFVVSLFRRFADKFPLPHELVPANIPSFVNAHCLPRFDCCFLPLPFGLPPSLPHSRILETNSRLPHCLILAAALRLPNSLAALFLVAMKRTVTYR